MITINKYILEKLHLNKDIKTSKSSSMYEDIYDVHLGDKVLILKKENKSGRITAFYISLYVGEVTSIDGKELSVTNVSSNKSFDEIPFEFEDHTHSTPRVSNCFALWTKPGFGWAALMKKDKALKLMSRFLKTYDPLQPRKVKTFNSYRLLPGLNHYKLITELKDILEENK